MKYLAFISFLFILNYNSFSQPQNADSLNAILDTITSPKDQIYFCMDQGDVYTNSDLSSFEYWYLKGVEKGKGTEVEYMLVMLYAYLGLEYESQGNYEKHAEMIHLGKKYVTDEMPFSYLRTLMSSEAEYYLRVEQYDQAIEINNEIISLAILKEDSIALSGTLHNIGISYYHQGKIDKADSLIKEALVINNIIGQNGYALANLTMLANIESKRGNHQQSLNYNLEAKIKFELREDISGMTFINSNISENYWDIGDKRLAYLYADSSLQMSTKHGLKEWEWITYQRLAGYYESDEKYKSALKYFKLYSETKTASVNEQSATKLESLESELNASKLEVLEKNEALQKEQLKLQDEKIKTQNSENAKKSIQQYFLIGGLLAAALFGFFIYKRLKFTKEQNKIIEEKNIEVQMAYEEIAEKNMDITASINYAKRIQNAILPTKETLASSLKEHFILFKPKDLVSGDFYWTETLNDHTFIAAADCTGHGVPGALVSVICHNALNRSVKEFNLVEPGDILNKTREIVIEQFAKSNENVKDGMDIALCAINTKTKKLKFAGANNPLWIARGGEILATKGDKQPIGNHHHLSPFISHEIDSKENDIFYIFSDGYADQFGGVKGKKFKSKSLATLLVSLKEVPIDKQAEQLDLEFEKWKADFEQLDDVCVIGFTV